tara:strand:+ start:4048 stop:7674 length:3627 start_codon:yes stop_codon:yes gene_type:complete
MSIYIQEVLGLLKRNKKKLILDKKKDHFEFGKLYQNSSLNNVGTYGPQMEPFVIKWGDLVCQATENLTRTQPGSGNNGYVPVYTDPEGTCSWDTLKDSIITQNAVGDTINIAGNLYVTGTITTPTLTEDRVVIVGPGGVLEDDGNFTMDGTTFTANVDVVHGTDVPAGTPAQTTRINSNLKLEGPVYDSLGVIGGLNKVLVGLADGRVKWQDDDVVEALTYGALWQGDPTNYKVELLIGAVDQILISDGTTFSWQDNPSVKLPDVLCDIFRIPLWAPDNETIGCSLMIQDGDGIGTPATEVKNEGKLHQVGDVRLDTVTQDDTLTQVLVRDPGAANVVKWRDALSIVPELGWDLLDPQLGVADWDVVKYNGYMESTPADTTTFRAIRPNNVTSGQEGYFVFVAERADIPLDYLIFSGVNGSLPTKVRTTWTGNQAAGNPYTPTAQAGGFWQQGTAVKFHWILRVDAGGNEIIWWDACCEIAALNQCPIVTDTSFTTNEDTAITGQGLPATDDGTGTLTWSIVTPPPANEGVITLNAATGIYDFTPAADFCGSGTFTWLANDTFCDSNLGTVTYNITCVCDVPSFAVYSGPGVACGAASIAPVHTGSVGDPYNWEGDYCDPDNAYTDVTLTSEYSTDGQTTWNAGLPANFTLQKDVDLAGNATPWKFAFKSTSVPAGTLSFRLTLVDTDAACTSQYIFNVTAALDILNKFEFQVDNIATVNAGNSRVPQATNTNLGMFGATGGDWATPAYMTSPGWFGSNQIRGRKMTDTSTQPAGIPGSGVTNGTIVSGVSATGGTYPGIGTATFQMVMYTALNEIMVFVDTSPSNDNIAVGQTVIFDAATINAAFSISAGQNVTGVLTCLIRPEDIAYAPLATGTITLAQGINSAHGCNQGAFKIYAQITNSAGVEETYLVERSSTSNASPDSPYLLRYTLDSYQPPSSYVNYINGMSWTRLNENTQQGNLGAPGIVDIDNIDLTRRGTTNSQCNTIWNYAHCYSPTTTQGGAGSNYSTTGAKRMQQSLLNTIAANTADGLVRFKIVGDTWRPAQCSTPATATVTAVSGGAVTAWTLNTGGNGYTSFQGQPKVNFKTRATSGSGTGLDVRVTMLNNAGAVVQGPILTEPASPNGVTYGGTGYSVGDTFNIDANATYVATSHGDVASFRMFKENVAGTNQVEIFNGPPWNNAGNNTTFQAGDGTAVQVDIFNDTVTIV